MVTVLDWDLEDSDSFPDWDAYNTDSAHGS